MSKDDIIEIFNKMKNEANWDPENNEMLFGYFFTDKDRNNLEKGAIILISQGYKLVKIRKDDDENYYWLHVEKIEKHSVDSLDSRNKILYKFAKENNIELYDGWDVGPIEK